MTARTIARPLLALGAALLAACSSGDSKLFQHIEDQQSFQTGELQIIKLRRGGKVTTLTIPANALPTRTRVTVSLVSGVVKKGEACAAVDDSAVQIAPAGLAFSHPVRMAQPVSPPAPMRHYAAAQVPDDGGSFVERGPGRRLDETATGEEDWEVDVDASGLWRLCESSAAPGSNGGSKNGTVIDEAIVRVGAAAASVVLGSGARRTNVIAPAQPPGVEMDVYLQLLGGVMRAGTPPVNDTSVRIAPLPVPPPTPMRAQQTVPAPPPGKTYAVAVTPDDGTTWTPMMAARQVPGGATPDGGVLAAVTDTGQRWEMQLPRPGIYGLVLVNADGTPDGTPDGGVDPEPDGGVPDAAVVEKPAQLVASAPTLDFGSVLATTMTQPLEVTIRNAGTLESGVPVVAIGGTDAASFAIASNDCAAALRGAGTCKVTLTFKPVAAGPRSASLTVSAVPGESAVVALTGTGQAPGEIRVAPSRLDFMAVTLGATSDGMMITVTNPGDVATGKPTVMLAGADAGSFTIGSNFCTASLPPAATCQVQVAFKPTVAGAKAASLVVAATPGGQANVALAGTGVLEAKLTVAPTLLDFMGIESGKTSGTRMLRVTNTGDRATGTLATNRTGTNVPDFAVVSDGCFGKTLAGGASCDVVLSFTPAAVGPASASFVVTGAPGGSVTTQLTGTGLAPAALAISGSGAIGGIVMGSSGTAAFMVKNNGGVPSGVPVVSVAPSGSDFKVSKNTCTAAVAPAATCGVEITFTPSATGARTATLTVSATPGGAPTAALSGTGIAPGALAVSAPSAAFTDTLVGSTSNTVTFTVTNQGGSATGAPTVALGGTNATAFTVLQNGCTVALAANATCSIDVRFAPLTSGTQTATLGVSATPGGMVTAALSAKALAPATLKIAPDTADFGTWDVGVQAQEPIAGAVIPLVKTFTVTNAGDVATGIVSIALGGTDAGDFGGTANKCVRIALNPGASCTFGTTFTPTAIGKRSATVTATGTPGGSASATVTGTGKGAQFAWDYTKKPDGQTVYYDFGVVPLTGNGASFTLKLSNVGDALSGAPTVSLVGDTTNFQLFTPATSCGRFPNGMQPGGQETCEVGVRVVVKNPGFHSTILRATGTPGGTTDIEFRVTEQ